MTFAISSQCNTFKLLFVFATSFCNKSVNLFLNFFPVNTIFNAKQKKDNYEEGESELSILYPVIFYNL
ncbi:hypothetical protein B9Z55_010447 [Caenorhabditis nigoni]|uniref:Uncharacterized protein n=1 Tax=Caenorhabditis nigoni TaxID=1611254 RepID=A0A2G5UG01_9PELO|nr:hypothetical protein B9Z55_010447 [Caenorhabditis nigoni]